MNVKRTAMFSLPLIAFIVLAFFLHRGLTLNPREVPSPFIGKPAPTFSLPGLAPYSDGIGTEEMIGQVWLLNVFASWCRECIAEHLIITKLAAQTEAPVLGLNYKDRQSDAVQWLQRHGNPYDMVVVDQQGSAGLDWGVYGVPETFVMDKKGIVRYKHIGPVSDDDLEKTILPLLAELKQAS